ncbi:MAG: DUF1801 domain-containing protein [Pseudomonadota bacterium]
MSELKTKKSNASVAAFLDSVEHDQRRADGFALIEIFKKATNMQPRLWGDSIVGFGEYHYKSERSSQEGDWPLTGFSPRKRNMTVYIMPGFSKYKKLLAKLGKHKTSVSCLYFSKLENIDVDVLAQIIEQSVEEMKMHYEWKC